MTRALCALRAVCLARAGARAGSVICVRVNVSIVCGAVCVARRRRVSIASRPRSEYRDTRDLDLDRRIPRVFDGGL